MHDLVADEPAGGTVSAWGSWWPPNDNYYPVTVPAALTSPTTAFIVQIAAGADHDVALRDDGTITVWGYDASEPWNSVPWLHMANVQAVAAGFEHTAALSNGVVLAWGSGLYNNTNVPSALSNVVQIAAGAFHTLALTTNGAVVAWGAGSTTNQYQWNWGQSLVPAAATNVVGISAGGYHSMALRADGTLLVWGDVSNVPPALTLTNVIDIVAGQNPDDFAICAGAFLPMIVTQPTNQYTLSNQVVSFIAYAYGVNAQYQWQFNGTNLAGATNSTLTFTNAGPANDGNYQAVITDAAGSATTAIATNTVITVPQILSANPPPPSTNYDSQGLQLSVNAAPGGGSYPLTYFWLFKGAGQNRYFP
jgi:alpha-tubulin suppressor-like RCC1 family protein